MIAFVKRYAGFLFLLLSVGGLIVLSLDVVDASPVAAAVTTTSAAPAATSAATTSRAVYVVEVRGEVDIPGRYVLAGDATVADAIALAGGATATADLDRVNLAKAVYDGMVLDVPGVLAPTPAAYVYVDVKGAVRYPGVYRIAADLRVVDAVMLAGGLTESADTASINLASGVADGMMIVVPTASAGGTATTSTDNAEDGKIDINTATVEELDTLYGIGYILAQRIIDYRAENGPFASIEEIMNVAGIKDSVYEKIKDDIRV
ncbi:MAG: SLBB domain-containing protein [Candidatus Izemoplasmatales bacterium]